MKKVFTIVAAGIIATALLAGCSSGSNSSQGSASSQAAQEEVQVEPLVLDGHMEVNEQRLT